MDLKQLNYLISVVENDFNLTRTAESLFISQPTLSVTINRFEEEEQVKLFTRKGQRINGLTATGEQFIEDSRKVLESYYKMLENLHAESHGISGEITLGIPPLVLSVLFSEVMPNLMVEMQDVKFNIVEKGADALTADLLTNKVDIAVLLQRHNVPNFVMESHEVERSELGLFMSKDNPLADKEGLLTWKEISEQKMALFSPTFMIHHLVKDEFKRRNLIPNIVMTSISWDFLISSIRLKDDLVSPMPLPLVKEVKLDHIVVKKMEEPIPWKVSICRNKKLTYSKLENRIFEILCSASYE